MNDRTSSMRKSRRQASTQKKNQVRAVLAGLVESGDQMSKSGVAEAAGVSRSFMRNPEIVQMFDEAVEEQARAMMGSAKNSGRVKAAALTTELKNAQARNKRQQDEIRTLRSRLSRAIGLEVAEEHGLPTSSQEASEELVHQVDRLEREKIELREALDARQEELEAAQAVNRDLLTELNRKGKRT